MIKEEFTPTDKELDLMQRLVYAGLTVREAYALIRAAWMAIGSSFAKEQLGDKTYGALYDLLKEQAEDEPEERKASGDADHVAWLAQVSTDAARQKQLVTLIFEQGLRVCCWVDGKAIKGQLYNEMEGGWMVDTAAARTVFVPYAYIWIDYMPDRNGIVQGTTCVEDLEDGDRGIVLHPMNADCTNYMVHWTSGSCPGSNLTVGIDEFKIIS